MRIVRTAAVVAALVTHCSTPSTSKVPQLTIPAIGLSRPVAVGDQQQIDKGNVVNYSVDSDDGCWPGDDCTVWLAGHRTSHGGVFRKLPQLTSGDEVIIHYAGSSFVYVVTGFSFVDRVDPPPGFLHGDLMLQTSWTRGRVLLVYADQVLVRESLTSHATW